VVQQVQDDSAAARGMVKFRTPAQPPSATANVTRKPTPLPKVHLPHARGMEAESNAPGGQSGQGGQGLKPAVDKAKKVVDKVVKTTTDKTVPPITGPIL
jgi:hypothetical protein